MALKDDIRQALVDSEEEWMVGPPGQLVPDTQLIADKVWVVLEDKVGAVQEKLMVDLGHARTQRDQALARAQALRETVAQQAAELDHLRSQVAQQ